MLGRKAVGMFVKVDGVEALQKDMPEEFIINSVLSWKLCKRTYNKQLDFFVINSAFPSLAGITALRSGRLLVVANAALNLQPKTLFLKKKKKKKTWKATCEKAWTITLWRILQHNFLKLLCMEEKADATPEVPPTKFEVPAAPIQVSSKIKTNMACKKSWRSCGW